MSRGTAIIPISPDSGTPGDRIRVQFCATVGDHDGLREVAEEPRVTGLVDFVLDVGAGALERQLLHTPQVHLPRA